MHVMRAHLRYGSHESFGTANRRLVQLPAPAPIAGHRQPVHVVVRDGEADTETARWLLAALARVAAVQALD